MSKAIAAALAALGIAAAGCNPGPAPSIDTTSVATADGLYRVRNSSFQHAWAKPDVSFAGYDKIWLELVSVSYKRKPKSTRYDWTHSNFALSESQMADFQRYFHQVFEEELSRSTQFALVDEAGPSTLKLDAHIVDLVIKVPTEERATSDVTLTASTGQMTLVLDLHDSLSGEILARIAERREARQAGAVGGDLYFSNSVTNTESVKRLFRRWARILTTRLDQVREIDMAAPPADDVSRTHLINPPVASDPPSLRSLRCEISPYRRICLRFRALISQRIRAPGSVGVYEMGSS